MYMYPLAELGTMWLIRKDLTSDSSIVHLAASVPLVIGFFFSPVRYLVQSPEAMDRNMDCFHSKKFVPSNFTRLKGKIIHGNQSCGGHFVSFLVQAYKRALPVYLPVYLIPALIVHRQGLANRPYTILGKGLLGTARSSLFLSVYCSSAWLWTCFCFRLFKRCNIPMVAIGTFPTGIALAIEKKSRRIEISLYCLARAIESFFTCMADLGYLPPQSKNLKRADVVVFSISTAIIMHCYAIERDVFRSKYLNVLDWVFGVPLSATEATLRKSIY